MSRSAFPVVDLALARRLERAEGHANAQFVESRRRRVPALDACWTEVGGAWAMFDGVGSPLTQTFGLGLFDPATADILAALEQFFEVRGAEVFHEVSPLADPSTLMRLNDRAYRPCELTSVLFQPLPAPGQQSPSGEITARPATAAEHERWAETALAGWGEVAEVRDFMSSFGPTAVGARDAFPFMAVDEGGAPVATGMLSIHAGVAVLGGASTVPASRGRGAQRALLAARLQYAAHSGCDLAMMCAAPGSASQRNAERSGFRIAYTRIKWRRDGGSL
ncbi:MAG TPA: GNAT family N-acetyltransferase [Vicinamibacterales bacterium]|nr:GNAT family N-acetyltransferase [Vicinamibacterales bacterium]